MDVVTSNECNKIVNDINKMTDIAIETMRISSERAKAAEQTLRKVKSTLSLEINNAHKLGFIEGVKSKPFNNENNDDTGGSQRKEDIAKLVLESKN